MSIINEYCDSYNQNDFASLEKNCFYLILLFSKNDQKINEN